MKIAWFTPFSQKSAIGMVSKEICDKLAETIEVDIWTHNSIELIETSLNVITFNINENLERLKDYNFIIYNIGNFAGNHRDIYDVSQKYPGIVILHDQTMSGFWGQYYTFAEFGGDPVEGYKGYIELFRTYYGDEAADYAKQAWESGYYPIYDYEEMHKYHLIEPIVKNAIGVFTHAKFFCDEIKKYYNGPIGYTYLPCKPVSVTENNHEIFKVIESAKKQGKKVLVSNGIVHPVKQIDKIAEALVDNSELREKIVYIVIGSYGGAYGDSLKSLSETSLANCLYMMDYQPYEVMNRVIYSADMCVNLRYPNSEVCSLSLLEQMSYGKPVLVIDSGIYGEVPDNSVVKIDYVDLKSGIEESLKALINNDKVIVNAGINASLFIKENCTIDVYCKNIIEFLESLGTNMQINRLQNSFLADVASKMNFLGINESIPSSLNSIVNSINSVFNKNSDEKKLKTIGVWAGFIYEIPNLAREGIARFMEFMIPEIAEKYNLNVEVWCYSFNEAEIRRIFAGVKTDKLSIITEKNWIEIFSPRTDIIECVGKVSESSDNLNNVAYHVSKADIMLPMIVYLDNAIGTGKRIFVPAHDMAVADHYDDFIIKDSSYKFRHFDIVARAENLARNGAVFFSNCNNVRYNQVLKYIKNLKEENTAVVYLPVNIPKGIKENIAPEKEIRDKFDIKGRYLFYPTQIRPYKNVSTLVKALSIVAKKYHDLVLVLTGNVNDVPEVADLIKKHSLENRVKSIGSVSEYELYSIYKYASAVPVPSLFEGGFPWQACEALFMNAPLALAKIDVVEERVNALGFTAENSGLYLFDPMNEIELADKLSQLIEEKSEAVSKQAKFAEKLLSYSWKDAAEEYYKLFNCDYLVKGEW